MAASGPVIEGAWELVTRVAESPMFHRSGRLRELLLYVCRRSIDGRYDELREQRIGVDVFARGPDFRPNEDNIVRVEARQLRKRLEEYFATEGKAEPIVITIPKGAYVAAFEVRPSSRADPIPMVESSVAQVSEAEPSVAVPPRRLRFSWTVLFFCTTLLFLAIAAWALIRSPVALRAPSAAQSAKQNTLLWSELFDKNHQTYIVCADSALVLLQELTGHSITLAEYVNRQYSSGGQKLAPEVEMLLRILPQRQYTNISDVRLVEEILQINDDYRSQSAVRSSRNIELIDFKHGNFVLLGSKRSTPWVELFEPRLNFHFVYDPKTQHAGFRNVNPRPGEQSVYWVEGSPTELDETYGVIAFLPNLSHSGNVLIVQGATGEGTEAAGEYITHPELLNQLLRTIHAVDNNYVRYFEVLLKSGTIAGTPKDAQIVSYRFIPTNE
ncbi:MAG: hypothetical protein WA324_12655 [Bryobacteraceae bacterium]